MTRTGFVFVAKEYMQAYGPAMAWAYRLYEDGQQVSAGFGKSQDEANRIATKWTRQEGTMRAEVFRGKDGEWRFRVVAGNNEPVAQSEGYKNQGDAKAIATDLVGEENVRVEEEDR